MREGERERARKGGRKEGKGYEETTEKPLILDGLSSVSLPYYEQPHFSLS